MAKNAWGASVWGASASAAADQQYDGDDACNICMQAKEVVELQPCAHKCCEACVGELRKRLIFKTENSVNCPFCRGRVDGYKNIEDGAETLLTPAAANRPAAQNGPAPAAGQRLGGSALTSATSSERMWACPRCRITNSALQRGCINCHLPQESGTTAVQARVAAGTRDMVTGARAGDLIKLCNEKYHPGLNLALQAAGVPSLEGGGITEESRDAILAAVRVKGQARLVGFVRTITDAGRWLEVSLHTFGSYTMQDLLHGAAQLRNQLTSLHEEPDLADCSGAVQGVVSEEAMVRALGGKPPRNDLLGMLVKPILDDAWNHLWHEKGFFVVARLTNTSGPYELAAYLAELAPHLPELLAETSGKHSGQLHRSIWRLTDMLAAGTPFAGEVADKIACLCQVFVDKPELLLPTAQSNSAFRLPWQLVNATIPRPAALQLGRRIAESAKKLTRSHTGLRTLMGTLQIRARTPEDREGVRDMLCLIADSLCGTYVDLAMRDGKEGPNLVSVAINRLAEEGEEDWVGWLCCELAVQAQRLTTHAMAWQALMHGLAQPILDDASVEQHLSHIRTQVADMAHAEARLWRDRAQREINNPQPAAPHDGRSPVQPKVTTQPPPEPPHTQAESAPEGAARAAAQHSAQQAQQQHQAAALQAPEMPKVDALPAAPKPQSPQRQAPQQPAFTQPSPSPWQPPQSQASVPQQVPPRPAQQEHMDSGLSFGSFGKDEVTAAANGIGSISISPPQRALSATAPASRQGSTGARSLAAASSATKFDMQMFFPTAAAADKPSSPQHQSQQPPLAVQPQRQPPPVQQQLQAHPQQQQLRHQQLQHPPQLPQLQRPAFGAGPRQQAGYGQPQQFIQPPQMAFSQPYPAFSQQHPAFSHGQPPFSQGQPGFHQGPPAFSRAQPAFSQPGQPQFSQPPPAFSQAQPSAFSQAPPGAFSQPQTAPSGHATPPGFGPQQQGQRIVFGQQAVQQPPPQPPVQQQQQQQPAVPLAKQHPAQLQQQQQLEQEKQAAPAAARVAAKKGLQPMKLSAQPSSPVRSQRQLPPQQQPKAPAAPMLRRPAYQPPGVMPNGPVAPAPRPVPPASPPAPRTPYNPNPHAVPTRLATSALSSLSGPEHPQQQESPRPTRHAPPVAGQQPPQVQQQQAAPGSARATAAPPPPTARTWACPVCTYTHAGREAEFLRCAMCMSERP